MLLQEQSEEIEKKQNKEKKIFLFHFFHWNTCGANLIGLLECD